MRTALAAICAAALVAWAEDGAFRSEGTAFTLPKGRMEAGLGTPWSWGLNARTEISSYVLYDALVPGAGIKRLWLAGPRMYLASMHSVYSPTPLLNLLSREGTGGIIPPDNKIPFFLASGNYVLMTLPFHERHAATLRLGGKLCGSMGENTLETIDYFMVYARSAAWHTGYSFDAGIDLRGTAWRGFHYRFAGDFFLMPGMKGAWETEQTGLISWRWHERLAISAGARYVAGAFPFGVDWMIFPLADIRLGFGHGKKTGPAPKEGL